MSGTCVVCGKPLPPRHTRYCGPDCARVGANRLAREVTSKRERPKKPVHTITCPDCGQEVTVPIKSKRCPACQREANRRNTAECRRRKRAGRVRELGSTDLCERCGRPYTVCGGLQRYCKDCAPIAFRENERAASRAWNRAAYADPEKRAERNRGRARPAPPEAVFPVCGKSFSPSSTRGVYCSPACADRAAGERLARYEQDHRVEINDRKRAQARARLAAMSPEELAAHREQVNARARENYRKRLKKQMTEERNDSND